MTSAPRDASKRRDGRPISVGTAWQKLDNFKRGYISFADLPLLCDELGMAMTDDDIEDAASRIQRWQASRLLFQGASKWATGIATIVANQDTQLRSDNANLEAQVAELTKANATLELEKNDLGIDKADLEALLAELNEAKETLEQEKTDLTVDKADLEARVAELSEAKGTLEQEKNDLNVDKTNLEGRVAELSEAKETLDLEKYFLGIDKADLEAQVAELKEAKGTLEQEKTTLEHEKDEVREALLKTEARLQGVAGDRLRKMGNALRWRRLARLVDRAATARFHGIFRPMYPRSHVDVDDGDDFDYSEEAHGPDTVDVSAKVCSFFDTTKEYTIQEVVIVPKPTVLEPPSIDDTPTIFYEDDDYVDDAVEEEEEVEVVAPLGSPNQRLDDGPSSLERDDSRDDYDEVVHDFFDEEDDEEAVIPTDHYSDDDFEDDEPKKPLRKVDLSTDPFRSALKKTKNDNPRVVSFDNEPHILDR